MALHGRLLGTSWTRFGRSWALLEALGGVLEALEVVLEAMLGQKILAVVSEKNEKQKGALFF